MAKEKRIRIRIARIRIARTRIASDKEQEDSVG
jgi:hypothetical protein